MKPMYWTHVTVTYMLWCSTVRAITLVVREIAPVVYVCAAFNNHTNEYHVDVLDKKVEWDMMIHSIAYLIMSSSADHKDRAGPARSLSPSARISLVDQVGISMFAETWRRRRRWCQVS